MLCHELDAGCGPVETSINSFPPEHPVKFKIPQTLDGLTREQLVELETQAVAAFDEQRDDPKLNADGMSNLRALATFITTNRDAQTALDAAEAAAAAELESMVNAVHVPEATDEPEGGEEGDGEDEADDEQDNPQDPAAPPAPPEVAEVEEAPATVARVAEPVAAAATTTTNSNTAVVVRPNVNLTRAAAGRTRNSTELGIGNRVVITAAADLPNYSNGHRFKDLKEVGEALRTRLTGFPNQEKIPLSSRTKMYLRQGVANITIPQPNGLVADGRNDAEIIEAACDTNRLAGKSLVAAGGWCPPPVQLWDLCPSLISVEGTVDLPSFGFTRTGVTWPNIPDLIPDIDNIGFHYTEQDAIDGTPKTCYTMPCTTWETAQMTCDGICIKGDIINDSSWPEYYDRLLGDVLKLHQLKLARQKMAGVIADSTPVDLGAGSDIAADNTMSGLFSVITLAAADYRRRALASSNQELEVLLPSWLPDVAAADASRRGACCGTPATTRAAITSQLASANVRVQWITGWQDYFGLGSGLGGATPATTWPNKVQFIIFAPGAFAFGTRNIIRLDAVYDSTLLEQNEYIRLFSEECSLFIHRCYPSYIYTMGLCPSGATAAPVDYACSTGGNGGGGGTATGSSAGTPGSFTPGGSTAPANLAAMSTVTASPTTAWTTGQYVVLGDNSHAHWTGTAWAAGDAP